jgi:hypothetical protein
VDEMPETFFAVASGDSTVPHRGDGWPSVSAWRGHVRRNPFTPGVVERVRLGAGDGPAAWPRQRSSLSFVSLSLAYRRVVLAGCDYCGLQQP